MSIHTLKILHLLGLTLFLGSIFGHIVSSALGGEPGGSAAFIAARQHISVATRWLTLPGLALLILSGLGLIWLRFRFKPPRWLQIHAALAGVTVVLTLTLVLPALERTLSLAQALANGSPPVLTADVARAKHLEDVAGTVSVLLTLVIVGLGVIRPALRPLKQR